MFVRVLGGPLTLPFVWLVGLLAIANPAAMAIKEPEYRVVTAGDEYEVREYASYIVAETVVAGSLRGSGNAAFRILAGYIFGKNQQNQKMKMTAPVETRRANDGQTLMLSRATDDQPAGRQSDAKSRFVYAFVMERSFAMDTLPAPIDPRITLREVPSRQVAVRRFSGRWSDSNLQKNERALMEALKRDGLTPTTAPMLARYDGPMTPWFMRRNEVMVDVAPRDQTRAGATDVSAPSNTTYEASL